MISAFWHGYYAGYYISSALFFLQIYANNIIFKFSKDYIDHPIIKLHKSTEKYAYPLIWIIWTGVFITNGTYFVALSGKSSMKILALTKYFGPIFLILLIILFKPITPKRKSADKNQ